MKSQRDFGKVAAWLSTMFVLALLLVGQAAPAQNAPDPLSVPVVNGDWGETKEGLRVGLFLKNSGRQFHYGDILTFVVRVWNVSEKDFDCTLHTLPGNTPLTLTGNHLQCEGGFSSLMPLHLIPLEVATIPGGTIKARLLPPGEKAPPGVAGEDAMPLMLLPGKYTLEYFRPLWISNPDTPNSATIHPARPLPITFTILPDRSVEPIQLPRLDLPQPNVLWGDTVNGIQSGISFAPVDRAANPPNQRMVFQHWVRNMTVRPFTVSYTILGAYNWNGSVTDAAGNWAPVIEPLSMYSGFGGGIRGKATVTLKPGEPLVLQKTTLQLGQGGKEPDARYLPRMTAQSGVYDVLLTDRVECPGLNMLCTTPKVRFTIPR